ncbi:MAG: anaerobic ribonucleoside-triphosphate reductase activating protein [Gammaproteobacteria bacterium]|nr:anaerobic ribonucleoside-triphosphate reductase activating protein [Gammaproteobacteria bacterium]
MDIGGLQKVSLIDYPGEICAVIFTRGCDFRCGYCYNAELVLPERYAELIPEQEVLDFLQARRGKLDAVTITGGEPAWQADLPEFIHKVKNLGFLVKLDTNGFNPEMLKKIIDRKLVDYIAMDVKAPLEKYRDVINIDIDTRKIAASIALVMDSGVPYEFRTTVVKSQLGEKDILAIGKLIKGARRYVLQKFLPGKVLDASFLGRTTYEEEYLRRVCVALQETVSECSVR